MKAVSVSVIMPVYNGMAFIAEAVDSVIGQSMDDWELIIVDDGSTDGTGDYLGSLAHHAIRILSQENAGVSTARNAGLEVAQGTLITFLDADDCLPPDSLLRRAEFLFQNADVDIVDGVIRVFDESLETEIKRYVPYYNGPLLPRLLRLDSRVFFSVPYMFRRERLATTRFPEHMTHAEDLAFYLLLADRHPLNYGHIDSEVYWYRGRHDSAMSNLEGLERGYHELIDLAGRLNHVTRIEMVSLRLRIAKILILSWGAEGNWWRGIRAGITTLIR